MADTQSVAKAQADLDKATAEAAASRDDMEAKLAALAPLQKAQADAYGIYLAASKANGVGNAQKEYAAYQAARSAATDAKSAYLDAQTVYEADELRKAQAADALTAAQKAVDTASSQTASDAVADKTANPATTTQTATTSNPVTTTQTATTANPATQDTGTSVPPSATPLPAKEKANIYTTNSNDDVQVVNGPAYSGAGAGRGSYAGYNAADEVASREKTQIGGPAQDRIVTANPLGAYSSYTYNINLHALTAADYKVMVETPENFVPTRNIISGANLYNRPYEAKNTNITMRATNFADDFYFDGLSMTTVIGLNAETRSSNSIEIKFTIIEPYGMTLMNRLVDLNRDELNGTNYLDTPYLLEINFFGADDAGILQEIIEQKKWICVKLINMKIKAGVKGSEYQIQAVPYNYQGNFTSTQVLKSNFNVTAGTVAEYFDSGIDAAAATQINDNRSESEAYKSQQTSLAEFYKKYPTDDEQAAAIKRGELPTTDKKTSSVLAPPKSIVVKTKSLTGAYNLWNTRELDNGNVGVADQIAFNIHDDIKAAKIVDPQKTTTKNSPSADSKTAAKGNSTGNTGPAAVGPNLTQTVHNLNAGTQILAIIDMVMLNSDYILNQLTDPSIQNKTKGTPVNSAQQASDLLNGKPVNWYRVIPQIELLDYDTKKNKWGKKVTYHIQPYTYHNSRHPAAEISLPPKPVKEYQYMYTGHNTEVINFDIDFNALFFTAAQVNTASTTALNVSKTDENKLPGNDKSGSNKLSSTGIQPTQKEVVSVDKSTTSGQGETRSEVQNAGAFAKDIYTSAGADMINLKLDILGDPQFIKQDDILYNPLSLGLDYKGQFVPKGTSGSLAMDNSEIFCVVIFKTPVDFDDTTGLLRLDSKYSVSYFSGYYKILTVESEFKGGKFTQKLNTVRYSNQPQEWADVKGQNSNGWDVERNADNAISEKSQNPAIASNSIELETTKPISSQVDAPVAKTIDDNIPGYGTAPTKPQVLPGEEVPQQDENLKAVAEKGETKTMDQATSANGNTVPVQSTNVPEANQQALKDRAYTQIDELSKANAELLAQNRGLQLQNSNLNSDDSAQASQMAQNRAQIAQNKATMLANGNKASEIDSQYKLYQTSVITSKDGTVINLG